MLILIDTIYINSVNILTQFTYKAIILILRLIKKATNTINIRGFYLF
ncbi:hypothetical protein QF004_002469 [Chryseobacterium sp. MDT2-18]|nr:hypothetical protein [Chryseobacterium sp. MDT2-18]